MSEGGPNEGVERPAVLAFDALLELGIDVRRHLRVGVPDQLMTHSTSKRFAGNAIEM